VAQSPAASVLIRAKDQERDLEAVLEQLASQTAQPLELIVVDGGSRDRTREVARAAGATVVEYDRASWSYGRSLNLGCAAASADAVVTLSADARPPGTDWVERLLEHLRDERVACACGSPWGPHGRRLDGVWLQDEAAVRDDPFVGFSATGGALRAALWRERPFDEELPACEDREWALHWQARGLLVAVDPRLAVSRAHRRSLRDAYSRGRREYAGYSRFVELPPYAAGDLLRDWWSGASHHRSLLHARLDPFRAARLAGAYRARRPA
jgi:rhamnosyltransferase